MNEATARPRQVRSYVLRGGRITEAQQRALTEQWARFGLDVPDRPWDLPAVFGSEAPVTLEIGFGNGAHLAARARTDRQRHFIGVEVHRPGVGALLLSAAADGLTNLRVVCHDAVDVLQVAIAPQTLDEIEILFPDPWHKKRHHKRRLIQSAFVELVASRLRPQGILHLATDWKPYAYHMQEVLRDCSLLENTVPSDGFAPPPHLRDPTRFERRGTRLGHEVFDLVWRRRSDASQ